MRVLRWLWPRGLTGQLILGLTAVLLIAQAIVMAIFLHQQAERFQRDTGNFLVRRVALVANLIATTPPTMHKEVLKVASAPGLRFRVRRSLPGLPQSPLFHAWLKPHLAAHGITGATVFRLPSKHHDSARQGGLLAVPVRVQGVDAWLTLTASRKGAPPWPRYALISFAIAALGGTAVIVLLVRRAMRPLKTLSNAAERLGRGEAVEQLDERGPRDIRTTIAAFNRMQARLHRFVADRTRMVAAISHDLRSPITALRLRTEMVDQDDLRERMIASLDEMQQMVEATLAFAREDAAQEATQIINLAGLVDEVVQAYRERGAKVEWQEPAAYDYTCRPMALKRAIDNVLGNAIQYGERSRVRLEAATIIIAEDGPGIPEDKLDQVFEPFARLDESRSSETGGTGLGLAIARTIVNNHGGRIELTNLNGGGLQAKISLP